MEQTLRNYETKVLVFIDVIKLCSV